METIAAAPIADTFAGTFPAPDTDTGADTDTNADAVTNAFAVDERLTGQRERALEISWNNINVEELAALSKKISSINWAWYKYSISIRSEHSISIKFANEESPKRIETLFSYIQVIILWISLCFKCTNLQSIQSHERFRPCLDWLLSTGP